jgi:hypothetical protein
VALAGAAGPHRVVGPRPAAGPHRAARPHRAVVPHRAARPRAAARAHRRTAGPVPPTGVPVVGLPGKLRTARQGLGLRGSAAAHLPSQARVAKAGTRGARLTARRADMTGQPENAAVRLSTRVTKHDEPEDPGQAARAVAPGPPGGAARMAIPGGEVRATGRGSQRPTATSVAAPGPAAARGGPPRATPAAGAQPPAGTADPRRAAGGASRERRVPPAVVTGAQVPQGRAHTGPAMTMTATGARPQSVATARAPAARRADRPADRAARPGGRRVTGRQDPYATAAATGLRGRTARKAESAQGTAIAPAMATAAGTATGPGAATAARTATGPGAATAARTATAAGVASATGTATAPGAAAETARAAGAAGPAGTRRRPGMPTSPGRRYRSRSAPSSLTRRPGPSYTACRTT